MAAIYDIRIASYFVRSQSTASFGFRGALLRFILMKRRVVRSVTRFRAGTAPVTDFTTLYIISQFAIYWLQIGGAIGVLICYICCRIVFDGSSAENGE